MIYEVNGDLRSSMLIDGTAEARLADILTIMDSRTFPKRESENSRRSGQVKSVGKYSKSES